MISFTCPGCDRAFSVPEAFAGRRAKCKSCGGPIEVPALAPAASPPATAKPTQPAPGRLTVRTRRLLADAEQMARAFDDFPLIRVTATHGSPPETYEVEYRVKSLEFARGAKVKYRDQHLARITLTSEYPRLAPQCRMLTPVFHPNIDEATICVGDHWAAGERLVDLVIRIGEMLAFQAYNIKSPLNGEAAMWADLNPAQLPTDTRDLHPPGL